jgi:hypothetical protein
VTAAEFDRLRGQRIDGVGVGEVGGDEVSLAAAVADRADHEFAALPVTPAHDDFGASFGEQTSSGAADPAGPAGDERTGARQSKASHDDLL